jgi:hypothetical protein
MELLSALAKDGPSLVALIVVVIIFTRTMSEINKAQAASNEAINKAHSDNNDKRDTQWQDFLTEQRIQNTTALARLSAEITAVITAIGNINAELVKHDAWTRESADGVRRALEKQNKKTDKAL